MKSNPVLSCSCLLALSSFSQAHAQADWFSLQSTDKFKRFSVSAGLLVALPQGEGNPINTRTPIVEGSSAQVGAITVDGIVNAVDTSTPAARAQQLGLEAAAALDVLPAQLGAGLTTFFDDGVQFFKPATAGSVVINGVSNFTSAGTGLSVDDIKTLGLTFDYHFTDNLSMQLVGGFPPTVDISGKGQVSVPLTGVASPEGLGELLGDIPIQQDLFVTDLGAVDTVATARAWTPALQIQYQFGQSGVNKLRPFLGAGVMYGYFNELDLNDSIKADLKGAGDLVQNVIDGNAGQSIDGLASTANSKVKLDAADTFGPIISAGATYDFNEKWFGIASVSYAKLSSDIQIRVVNENDNSTLFTSKTQIDIDPILTYVGAGYRF